MSAYTPIQDHLCCIQDDTVLPARRIAKSKDATPVESDNDEIPDANSAQAEPAARKGKMRKAAPSQQDLGAANKRRKRSISQTPEPSDSGHPMADKPEEVSTLTLLNSMRTQPEAKQDSCIHLSSLAAMLQANCGCGV